MLFTDDITGIFFSLGNRITVKRNLLENNALSMNNQFVFDPMKNI